MELGPSGESQAFNYADLEPETHDKVETFLQTVDHLEFFDDHDRLLIESGLQLMLEVHAGQEPRPDGATFAEHPLSVAQSVLDCIERPSRDQVIAALLHDSVEDQAAKLAEKLDGTESGDQQTQALQYIERQFGFGVALTVFRLTNPDFRQELIIQGRDVTAENVNELYLEHVAEILLKDPEAAAIKLFDFSKNVLNVERINDRPTRLKLMRKYSPAIGLFIRYLEGRRQPQLLNDAKVELLEELEIANSKIEIELSKTDS